VSNEENISELDGERRQQVAAGLWRSWWKNGRGAGILNGFSGLGKTERVIRPLIARATANGRPAVLIDAPIDPMDLDKQLNGSLVEQLREAGATGLADVAARQPSFSVALRETLRGGALVVLDDFQRLLNALALPIEPLGSNLQRIAKRPPDSGCLWLVSSREIGTIWTEPFYSAVLEPPSNIEDAQHIVLMSIALADAERRFTEDRRLEVVRRLGANPRALRLLGNLLRNYPLEELLGPPGDVPQAPLDPQFTEEIERSLLEKTKEGLSNAEGALLRELTVLREPAPWELVEAIGEHLGDVRTLSGQLRQRYLLEAGNRYRLHPLVREVDGPRLRSDNAAWRTAHQSAGQWYARRLRSADHTPADDTQLTLHLAGARYHLVEAKALEELHEAIRGLQSYIERNYGWTARNPTNDFERNSQISLLDLYLTEAGQPGVEFQFAKLLKLRAAPNDLAKALKHAHRATVGQEFASPWILWIQLVGECNGLEQGIAAARLATEQVAPAKGLFSVYQVLASYLARIERIEDAVDALLEGAERADGNRERLVVMALQFSAAESRIELLQRVRDWADQRKGFEPQTAFGNVLLRQHQGDWRGAADEARIARRAQPTFINLAQAETLSWLGAGNPLEAQQALNQFTAGRERKDGWLRNAPRAMEWLEALVACQRGELQRASEILSIHLGVRALTTEAGIRSELLRQWDCDLDVGGESLPAFVFPILPPFVTGLDANISRPRYGPPVLPQHQGRPDAPAAHQTDRLHVLAIGDEWHSGHGGLSTFNRQLCRALAAAGAEVACLVLHASAEDRANAGQVSLVEATFTPGQNEREALARKPKLPYGFVPDIVIGHGRVTGPAAKIVAEDHFPSARRLHFVHMAPDEIEWFKLDREDDAGARAEDRTRIEIDLGRTAARVVAVGPRLHNRYLRDLSVFDVSCPLRLDPGFDTKDLKPRIPPPGAPWSVLMLGRLEDENPKGLDLAAKAVGIASLQRAGQFQTIPLELLVRGSRPNTSNELYDKLRAWSGFPGLKVIVRPFSTDAETLDEDIRRASLVLMPSRTEGFGLVGLEAIVAGTPVLVSSESGLGEMLRETLAPEQANRMVVPMFGDETKNSEEWGRAVNRVLSDRENAFRRAAEIREDLGKRKTWSIAIARLLKELSNGT
jgi:glycosyltransferase involved in cell wall biosynthesis